MTIDTQKLRDLIRQACPLPWALATSNSWRRILSRDGAAVCSPCNQPDGHPDLTFPGGAEGPTATLLIEAANTLPDLLDIIEALDGQVAEYARMLEKQGAEAGARIDAQAAEIARLRDALTQAKVWISRDEHGDECRGGIFCCCGKYDLETAIAVALAQE